MADRQTSGAAITFQNLGKSFDKKGSGQVMALEGVNLDVPAGTITGIIGRSGAGKSTLLRMVNGLEQPTSGTVTVAGHDVGRAGAAELRRIRRDVGMIFQHFNLLSSRTVYGNVALPLEIAGVPSAEIKRRVDDLIARVGLEALSRRYPAELSGGQKRRVSLAVALLHEPQLLLLDEPTVGVDPELRARIWVHLREIADSGTTVILTTHYIDEAGQADRVGLMRGGKLLAEDAPKALMEPHGHASLEQTFLMLCRRGGGGASE